MRKLKQVIEDGDAKARGVLISVSLTDGLVGRTARQSTGLAETDSVEPVDFVDSI